MRVAFPPAPPSAKRIPVPAVKTLSLSREEVVARVKYCACSSKLPSGTDIVICPFDPVKTEMFFPASIYDVPSVRFVKLPETPPSKLPVPTTVIFPVK